MLSHPLFIIWSCREEHGSGRKNETHRGAAKRFRVTRKGKVLRNSGWKRHLLEKKSSARKRRISGTKVVQGNDRERMLRMLGKR